MRIFLCVLLTVVFPYSASAFVGKWKLAKKKTYNYTVAQIKKNKKMKPKFKKKIIRMQKMILKANVVLTFLKSGTFQYVVKLPYGKGKVFKRTSKGTWKKTKKGLSYTTAGRYPVTRTCVKTKKNHLVCTLSKGGREKVTFYNRMK